MIDFSQKPAQLHADRFKRASLSPERVEMLTCLHHNLSTFGRNTVEDMDLDADDVDDP